MVKRITELTLPAYLRGLPSHLPIPLEGPRYSHFESWLETALDVMLAPYDATYSRKGFGYIDYVRPEALHLVTRKTVSEKNRFLDIKDLAHRAASDHRVSFEALVKKAAEAARPLGRPIDLIHPFKEQKILADLVFARENALEDVANSPNLLGRLVNRRWRITDIVAFCPDKSFRKRFVQRFRDQVNRQKVGKARDPFLVYQGAAIGYEIPGATGSVFADLIEPENIDADWFEYLLDRAQRQPGVLYRIMELTERGCELPVDAMAKLEQADLEISAEMTQARHRLQDYLNIRATLPATIPHLRSKDMRYVHP